MASLSGGTVCYLVQVDVGLTKCREDYLNVCNIFPPVLALYMNILKTKISTKKRLPHN